MDHLDDSVTLFRPSTADSEERSNGVLRTISRQRGESSKRDALDARLAIAARNENCAAYAAIVRRHKDWIYRYLVRHLRDEEEARDVLQEIFISIWRYLPRYDPNRSFKIWLSQIVLNKTRDRVRRVAAQRAMLDALRRFEWVSYASVGIETLLIRDEALKRVETAMEALQPQYKRALVLILVEGLSHSDAATKLGVTRKVMENRVLRAKERLAALLRAADLRDLVSAEDEALGGPSCRSVQRRVTQYTDKTLTKNKLRCD